MWKLVLLFCFFGFNLCAVIDSDWYFDSIEDSGEFISADNLKISEERSIVSPILLDENLETIVPTYSLDLVNPEKEFDESTKGQDELNNHMPVNNHEQQGCDVELKTDENSKRIPIPNIDKDDDANDQVFPVVGEVTFGGIVNSYGRVTVVGKSTENNEFLTISIPPETVEDAVPLSDPLQNVPESNLPVPGTINFGGTVRASGSVSVSGRGMHFGGLSGTPHFFTTSCPSPTPPWMMASFVPKHYYYLF